MLLVIQNYCDSNLLDLAFSTLVFMIFFNFSYKKIVFVGKRIFGAQINSMETKLGRLAIPCF